MLSILALLAICANAAKPATKPSKSGKKPPAPAASKSGQFTDSRNGKTYKTTTIGNQTWMAENLNFAATGAACYENQKQNCEKLGRLYDWETAKSVCPSGWHLPSDDEWGELEKSLGGSDSAGRKMKSTTGWSGDGNGTNSRGFNAIPAGNLDHRGLFIDMENAADFWTSSSKFGGGAWAFHLNYEHGRLIKAAMEKTNGLSVRCLKD